MNKDLAQMVVTTALRTRIELGDLAPLIAQHGEAAADEAIKLALGSAIYEIGLLMDRVFEQHPVLEAEIEARRQKYGRPYY